MVAVTFMVSLVVLARGVSRSAMDPSLLEAQPIVVWACPSLR